MLLLLDQHALELLVLELNVFLDDILLSASVSCDANLIILILKFHVKRMWLLVIDGGWL